MRVISGTARGLKLKAPEGLSTRPTADRIKESLFNIIAYSLQDISFLDLFSGSGAIGIEALSRGAKECFFVDNNSSSIDIIKENIKKARLEDKSTIYNMACLDALDKIAGINKKFDIIFLDPPYDKGLLKPVLEKIAKEKILKEDGFIICEQHIDEEEIEPDGFFISRIKEYKITKMVFLEHKQEGQK